MYYLCDRYPVLPEEKIENLKLSLSYEFRKLYHHLIYIDDFAWIRDRRVLKGLEYIRTNYQNDIFLKDTAEYAGLASSTLSKLLKHYTYRGFRELLNEVRIAHTVQMIWETDEPLKFIAYDCGFNTRRTFTREFKQHAGFTPSDFKAICKKLNRILHI